MQSQPTLSVNLGSDRGRIDIEGQDYKAESCVHLTNGYNNSGTPTASAVDVCSPREETGFADFTVFTEQVVHPWCCGFSSAEKLEGRGTNSLNRPGEHTYKSQQEVCVDSQLRPQDCTVVRHCEKRDGTLVLPTQDHHHHQPQETAAALVFPSDDPYLVEGGSDRDNQVCRRQSFDTFQTSEIQEDGGLQEDRENGLWQTCSVYDSVSEDLLSCCDDLSFDGPSADLEPNVSSLGSEEQTDWDQSEDEEALGNWEDAQDNLEELTQSKTERDFPHIDPSASQETLVTSNQPQSGTHTEDKFADFSDSTLDFHREPGDAPTGDEGVLILGTLPPSDSFADFCTANTQDDGEGSWSEFKDLKVQELGRTWTWTTEHASSLQTDRSIVDWTEQYEASLPCHVKQLLLASFPEIEGSTADEEQVLNLGALLYDQHLPKSVEDTMLELCPVPQWIRRGVCWLHQDLHCAVGLKFHWGGSHANICLLRSLGMHTKILDLLEPTKDSVPAACSVGHTAVTGQAPPGVTNPINRFSAGAAGLE